MYIIAPHPVARNAIYSAPTYHYGLTSYSEPRIPSENYGLNYGPSDVSLYYPQPAYGSEVTESSSFTTSTAAPLMKKMIEAKKFFGGWIWEKFKKKIDLILVTKVLLKLIVFKKIVKFIGVIVLLLFLPTMLSNTIMSQTGDWDEDERRRIKELDAYGMLNKNLKCLIFI